MRIFCFDTLRAFGFFQLVYPFVGKFQIFGYAQQLLHENFILSYQFFYIGFHNVNSFNISNLVRSFFKAARCMQP